MAIAYLSIPLLLYLIFATSAVHIVTNSVTKQPEFVLLNRQSLALPNYHRNRSSLQFSINGGHVLKIEQKNGSSWLLELDDRSRIYFEKRSHEKNPFVTEYNFRWTGGGDNREVCFHYGHNNASWYNTYQSLASRWPMDTTKLLARRHFNFLLDFDYDSSRDEHLLILEHLFLNSDGFALLLDGQSPLFIRRDPNAAGGDPLLCFSVNNFYPYMVDSAGPGYKDLKLRIFAGKNIKSVYGIVANQFGLIGKPVGIPNERLFRAPIWSTWNQFNGNLNQTNVVHYAEEVSRHGFPNSTIELHREWEEHYGDLVFDKNRFPEPAKLIADLHGLGHRVTLWVYPDIHLDSPQYSPAESYFVKDQSNQSIMINYSDGTGSYIDFSNPEATEWYVERLKRFQEEHRIDGYNFNEAVLYDFSVLNTKNLVVQKYPSLLTKAYVDCAYKLSNNMIILDSGFKTQYLPNFVNLNAKSSDWSYQNGLKSLIPTVLALSIAGYSFIIPGIIGGGYSVSDPPEELYIRWIQATTFMPAMKFSIPPWKYGPIAVNIARRFVELHEQAAPVLIELARRRVRDGSPIVRPMWFVAPDDPASYQIDDQFMVGDDLLVAPVLEEGARQRTVYLPPGEWADHHGTRHLGPGQVKLIVPLAELAYFKRITH